MPPFPIQGVGAKAGSDLQYKITCQPLGGGGGGGAISDPLRDSIFLCDLV